MSKAPARRVSSLHTVASNLLLVLVAVFSVQLVGKALAATYTLSSSTSESKDTKQVIFGDFDSDGDLDYIALNSTSVEGHDFYANDGSGTFGRSVISKTSNDFLRASAGDIDGDGDIDFVTADANGDKLYKYVNNGTGTFTEYQIATGLSPAATDIALIDVENDGDEDIVIGASSNNTTPLYLNNSHGVFVATTSPIRVTSRIAVADFNSDGFLDLALLSGLTVKIYKNSGTGAFVQISSYTNGDSMVNLSTGDLDADGDVDLIMAESTVGTLRPLLNDGAGALTTGSTFGLTNTANMGGVGDIDNDGDFDVIIAGSDSAATNAGNEIWLNNGLVSFTQSGTPTEESDCTNFVALGDIDTDGDLDYVAGNAHCTSGGQVNRHYKSDQAATSANTAPSAPSTGFGVTVYSLRNRVTTVDSVGTVGADNSVKVPSDDLPVISYRDGTNGDLKVVKCGNFDCTSGNTLTTVDSTNDVGNFTSLAIGSDGFPIISYHYATSSDLKVVKCGNAACSSGNTITTVDSVDLLAGVGTSIAIGNDSLPVIAYGDTGNGTLKVAKCGNAACSSGNTLTTVDSTASVGSSPSIAIGNDGFPVISYRDSTNSDLKVAKCGNAACSSGNTLTTVDSTGDVGRASSIAIGSDSFPILSYSDTTNGDLKVAKCGNAACSSGNTLTTVDSTGTVGSANSLVLGGDGFPIISYWDTTNTDVKVVKCGDASCSSGNTLTAVDPIGTAIATTSIAKDSSGFPVISYGLSGDLKVVKCTSASCSAAGTDGLTVRINWGSGSDTQTATRLMQYQLKVGTGSGLHNIMSGKTNSPNYVTRVMPNGQSRTMLLRTVPCNNDYTYYWSVATVDSGFRQSSWSTEQSFVIEDNCSITTSGGGTSGGSTGGSMSAGGGLPWSVLRQSWHSSQAGGSLLDSGGGLSLLPLTVSLLNDVTGDGKQTSREQPLLLAGLPVTAVGTAIDGTIVRSTVQLSMDGIATFKLPPSDKDGYTITFDPKHPSLAGYLPTQKEGRKAEGQEGTSSSQNSSLSSQVSSSVPTALRIPENMHRLPPIVLDSPTETTTTIALRREDLIAYTPCLTIGDRVAGEIKGADSFTLLQRLKDPYGKRIMEGISFHETLMTRKDFFLLLGRSQCTPQITSRTFLEGRLREAASTHNITLPLVDLPINTKDPTSLMIYSMIADGADVTRQTLKGHALDAHAPITRAEAIRALYSVLHIPKDRVIDPAAFLEDEEPEETSMRLLLAYLIEPADAQGLNLQNLLRRSSSSSSAFSVPRISIPSVTPVQNILNRINERLNQRTSSASSRSSATSSSLTTTTPSSSASSITTTSTSSSTSSLSVSSASSSISSSSSLSVSSLPSTSSSTSSNSSSSTSSSVSSSLSSLSSSEISTSSSSSITSTSSVSSSVSSSSTSTSSSSSSTTSSSESSTSSSSSSSSSSEPLKLPEDLAVESPLSGQFLTLFDLGILPKNFGTFFGENQGIDTYELATMIARAAFRNGKIDMLPPISVTSATQPIHSAAPVQPKKTFLELLPTLKVPSCLKKNTTRSAQISFTDLFPGDSSYQDIKELHSFSLDNSAKEKLWLLPATSRPTEFGIEKGQTKLAKAEPVSILETIRTLLILTCQPPDTAATLRLNAIPVVQGSAETRVPRDRISGLERDSTFASRILFKAQDRQTYLDLSLFTFAPSFLRNEETRSPASGLNILEASDLLASSLLHLALNQNLLSLEEAQNLSQEVSLSILKQLLTFTDLQDINLERDSQTLRTIPFTREMMLTILRQFLLQKPLSDPATPSATKPVLPQSIGEEWPAGRSLGEDWWERVG